MKLKILIVEDDPVQCRGMERTLKAITPDERNRHGIRLLEVLTARSASSALERLRTSEEQNDPVDIALLDLSLPEKDGEKGENPSRGRDVLLTGLARGAIRKAVIISAFHEHPFTIGAFRAGAVDFIAKPYEEEDLRQRILLCWSQLIRESCAKAFNRRITTLVPEAQRCLIWMMDSLHSAHIADIRRESEELLLEICQRQGLDAVRDSEDPLLRRLMLIYRTLELPQHALTDELTETPKKLVIDLRDALSQIEVETASCFHATGLGMQWPTDVHAQVRSSDRGVIAVIREIVMGTLIEMARTTEQRILHQASITVNPNLETSRVGMIFEDTLDTLTGDTREAINKGQILPADNFSRAWGLAVIQQVAVWGGGRIEVQTREGGGNRIIYLIPDAAL